MKRLLALAPLLLSSLSCVDNQGSGSIRFTSTRFIKEQTECSTDPTVLVSRGGLDLSGLDNYLIAPSMESNASQQPITVGGEIFSGKGLSDITVYEVVYTYQLADTSLGITLPAEEVVPYYQVIRPNTDANETYMLIYSMGPKALGTLQSYFLNRTPGPSLTVLSSIKARAYLSGGQKTESNIFRFPTTVFSSGFEGCPAGTVLSGKCGGLVGQDNAVTCVKGT